MNPIWLHFDFIDSYSQFMIRTLLPLKDMCDLTYVTNKISIITLNSTIMALTTIVVLRLAFYGNDQISQQNKLEGEIHFSWFWNWFFYGNQHCLKNSPYFNLGWYFSKLLLIIGKSLIFDWVWGLLHVKSQ